MTQKPNVTLKPNDPEQSKRFVETARQVEADETAEAFEKAFKKVATQPSPKSKKNDAKS